MITAIYCVAQLKRKIVFCALMFFAVTWSHSAAANEAVAYPVDPNASTSMRLSDSPQRIRFLVTTDFPPFSFVDQSGHLSGFNVALARQICRVLNVEARCQLQAVEFDEVQSALLEGQADAVMAGLAVTPKRRESFAFSKGYLQFSARFLGRKEDAAQSTPSVTAPDNLIGVINGSSYDAMAQAFFPSMRLKRFENAESLHQGLLNDEVNAVFSNGLHLKFWAQSEVAKNCCALVGGPFYSRNFLGEGMRIMARKNDPLVHAIDRALTTLAKNGQLATLYSVYFPNTL